MVFVFVINSPHDLNRPYFRQSHGKTVKMIIRRGKYTKLSRSKHTNAISDTQFTLDALYASSQMSNKHKSILPNNNVLDFQVRNQR